MQRGLRLLQEAKDQSGNAKVCAAAASHDELQADEGLTVQYGAASVYFASAAQLTEEQIRLLQMQEDLDKEYKGRDKETFVGLSVAQTMYRLFSTVTHNPCTATLGPCTRELTLHFGSHIWWVSTSIGRSEP